MSSTLFTMFSSQMKVLRIILQSIRQSANDACLVSSFYFLIVVKTIINNLTSSTNM